MRKLRLIDFDQVSLSSLNRHALATRADVGMPKATCLKASCFLCFSGLTEGHVRQHASCLINFRRDESCRLQCLCMPEPCHHMLPLH